MLDQQTVAIVYAAAGLAVSVGGNSGISLATFASIVAVIEVRSVIQRILLSKNTTVIVIGVLKVTDTLEYAYDAWGNVLDISGTYASTLGQNNPIRYRGYYYDSETSLYYLNS